MTNALWPIVGHGEEEEDEEEDEEEEERTNENEKVDLACSWAQRPGEFQVFFLIQTSAKVS